MIWFFYTRFLLRILEVEILWIGISETLTTNLKMSNDNYLIIFFLINLIIILKRIVKCKLSRPLAVSSGLYLVVVLKLDVAVFFFLRNFHKKNATVNKPNLSVSENWKLVHKTVKSLISNLTSKKPQNVNIFKLNSKSFIKKLFIQKAS